MNRRLPSVGTVPAAAALTVAALVWGCASSSETASRDTMTENVGRFDPGPRGVNKPRVGIPPFSVTSASGGSNEAATDALAADEMSTLLDSADRFEVIERAQLQKLLDEQHLTGVVTPGEMARPGQVRGVDYLLLGKVTNLRVKREMKDRSFGLAEVGGGYFNVGAADVKKKDVTVTTECGVDIRLVNPTTGGLVVSSSSDYKRTDSAGALGIDILGASAGADADLQISEDDKGKILRLALDDALHKAMPKIDKFLKSDKNVAAGDAAAAAPAGGPGGTAQPSGTPAVGTQAPAAGSTSAKPAGVVPASGAVAAKRFCPTCGMEVSPTAKFCPHDGTKLD